MKRMMLLILMGGVRLRLLVCKSTLIEEVFATCTMAQRRRCVQLNNILVKAGWADGNIYTQLKDGGAFTRNYHW